MKIEFVKPQDIEKRSMEIIEKELDMDIWTKEELSVVKRCIHTSADFDYTRNLVFSPEAAKKGVLALKNGASIVTDTNMAAAGINRKTLAEWGGSVHCFMGHEDVAKEAAKRGITRATVCMERAMNLKGPLIFAIGNAPTALIRLYDLIAERKADPALVIGVPVGFVNVVESKEQMLLTQVPYIIARGRKGGSNIAAAICNALLLHTAEDI